MKTHRIVTVMGTRPEAIKLAPVIRALREDDGLEVRILATAQHRELLDQVLGHFGLAPDRDLDLMRPGQTLPGLTARAIEALDEVLREERPDLVVVQGDTTTAMTGALASFYLDFPVVHVEAGLRSDDVRNPFPEEVNRRMISQLAALHCAPTEANRTRLLREGIDPGRVVVTGNPGIDAVLAVAGGRPGIEALQRVIPELADPERRLVLVTMHRRESFGAPLAGLCDAIGRLAADLPDLVFLIPVHPNPMVRETIEARLGDVVSIRLTEPLDYAPFVAAMRRASLILTDSGGVQEEAPSLDTPVLVLRDTTERPEVVAVGAALLVGRDPEVVHTTARRLLTDEVARREMTGKPNPYGDGRAAERIHDAIRSHLAGGS